MRARKDRVLWGIAGAVSAIMRKRLSLSCSASAARWRSSMRSARASRQAATTMRKSCRVSTFSAGDCSGKGPRPWTARQIDRQAMQLRALTTPKRGQLRCQGKSEQWRPPSPVSPAPQGLSSLDQSPISSVSVPKYTLALTDEASLNYDRTPMRRLSCPEGRALGCGRASVCGGSFLESRGPHAPDRAGDRRDR